MLFPQRMRRLAADDRGANFVEYMIIVGVVALVGIGAFAAFGGSVTGKIAEQGERLAAMQGSVRSLDVRSRPAATGAAARGESVRRAASGDGWESAAEPRAPSSNLGSSESARAAETTRVGEIDARGEGGTSLDAVAVVVTLLLLVGAYLVYRWKKGRRGQAARSLEQLLAPGARWMALVRSHVAGRLPWTPRE